jgi:c-di-AMP phosphodiesterase-like protein
MSPKALFTTLIDNACGVTAKGSRSFGGEFTVHAYPHISNNTEFFVIVLTEDTERNSWITKYNNNLTHIAYIAVDNLNELAQSDQESYRAASNQVAAIIKEWSTEYGAFIKEYEREKYVAIIRHKALEEIERKRFDLLERVSRIRIGSENLSVTVSAGVSPETGTLEEKDRSAQSALEMALARGGNQAVLMGESPKFFGAKAITSLKRSGVRHRVFADKLLYRIRNCSNVIIMGHRNPDFDAIGSCIGLARLALSYGKQTNIIANIDDANLRDCFQKLSGIPEYEGMFVDAIEAQPMRADLA